MGELFDGRVVSQAVVDELLAEAAAARPRVRKPYPCLRRFTVATEGEPARECLGPSSYIATGNEARYGHVCADCWESFEPVEQSHYAFSQWVGSNVEESGS
jgi:hypothetical protein